MVDSRIDKPWGNTLREKLHEPCACGIQIGALRSVNNDKETLGTTWARFSLLVKSDPTMSTLNPLVLWKFKRSLDKDSADYLNSITGGVPLQKFPAEANKILDYIAEYTSLSAESDPLQEECELTQEDSLAAEPNPSSSISLDSAIKSSPEPGTLEGEEIHPRSSQ